MFMILFHGRGAAGIALAAATAFLFLATMLFGCATTTLPEPAAAPPSQKPAPAEVAAKPAPAPAVPAEKPAPPQAVKPAAPKPASTNAAPPAQKPAPAPKLAAPPPAAKKQQVLSPFMAALAPMANKAAAPPKKKAGPAKGTVVTLSLRVENAPADVRALGYEIWFNPNVLEYVKYDRGELLAQGFQMFGANVVAPGRLRMGGIEAGEFLVAKGKSGELLRLDFRVKGEGRLLLKIRALKSHVKGWKTQVSDCGKAGPFSGLALCGKYY